MPVKVRCPECEKVLNAPDRARGKVLKCPKCEGRVKIPGKKRPKPQKRERPVDALDPLAGLDLRDAEDHRTRICPKCARVVTEEDIECPGCGVNIETGVLSERQKRKQARLGPDPEEFFSKVWKNSMTFTKKNKHLVFRTVLTWTLTLTVALCCFRTAQWCWQNHFDRIVAAGGTPGVSVQAGGVLINGTVDRPAEFLGKSYRKEVVLPGPAQQAHSIPPVIFWRVLGVAFQLGFGGWAIFLTITIVEGTMAGERILSRVQSDFFGNITMGIKFYMWPWLVLLPFTLGVPSWLTFQAIAIKDGVVSANLVLSKNEQIGAGVSVGIVYLLALFLVPAAAVHMAQKHTFPAFLLFRMLRSFFKTLAPSLALTGMLVLTCVLLPAGAAGGVAAGWSQVAKLFSDLLNSVGSAIGIGAGGGFFDYVVELLLFALIVGASLALLFLIIAWPAVYMMRAIGLFGLYFREDLDLEQETTAGEPVGFGPRYLAWAVDTVILSVVGGVIGGLYYVAGLPGGPTASGLRTILGLASVAFLLYYWVGAETGQARATPGKWSLGLMVLKDDLSPMTRNDGIRRTLCAFVTTLTFYAGFLMCLFDPEKRALHDKLTGTRVVWKGDDERT